MCEPALLCCAGERKRMLSTVCSSSLVLSCAFLHFIVYRYATFYESTLLSLYHQLYLKNQVCGTMNMLTEVPVKISIFFYLYTSPPSLSSSISLPLSYLQEIEGQQQQIEKLSTESREENIVQVAEHTHSLILGSLYHTV